MLKESLCLVLSQIPSTKTKLEHIWVLLNKKEKKLVWTKKRKYKRRLGHDLTQFYVYIDT